MVGACLAVAGCSRPAAPVNAPRPVVVEAPHPLGGPSAVEAFPGAVRARTEADLSFRVPGKVARRRVDLGSRVDRGTVIAELDPQDARLNLDAARSALKAAEADAWLAQEEERRYQDLKAKGHVGQSAVDQRSNTRKLAEARREQAQSQLNLAENQARYTQLTADAPGVITQVMAEPGNVVTAGQPVVRVALDGEREVRIDVPEGRVDAVAKAPQVMVGLFTQPQKRWMGRVREISPQANPTTRTHEARVTILEPGEIGLGVTATVLIPDLGDGKTFRLPASALGTQGKEQPVVWTAKTDANGASLARPVPVRVLQYLDGAVIVTGELAPTDRIVTAGVHLLTDGMPVRPVERDAKVAL